MTCRKSPSPVLCVLAVILIVAVTVLIFFTRRERVIEVQIGEPIVVAQKSGTSNSLSWGYFQFPRLYRTEGDRLVCKIAAKPDLTECYDGEYLYYVSTDLGNTWNSTKEIPQDYSLLMNNGRYFQGTVLSNAYESNLLDKYDPVFSNKDGTFHLLDGDEVSPEDYDFTFQCVEYDPVSMEENVFTSQYIWPHMPIRIINGKTCPAGMPMYHFNMHSPGTIIREKNSLFLAVYSQGFDAQDGSVVYGEHYNLYFFRSNDSARTWNYVSQINTTPEYCEDTYEGFCEPSIIELSNGDYFVLMRTDSGTPMYCAYSHDKGATWNSIERFSEVGVDPQLLKLDSGITLASYGRPCIYIRYTDDAAGKQWNQQIRILGNEGDDLSAGFKQSCCYTSLIALDERNALLAYSEFIHPDGTDSDSVTKRIIVRKILTNYRWDWCK